MALKNLRMVAVTRWAAFVLLGACKQEPSPAPVAQPKPVVSVAVSVASVAPEVREAFLLDLLFVGDQLFSCDEIVGPPEKLAPMAEKLRTELAKSKAKDEVLLEGKTCFEAASGRVWQAVCKRSDVSTAYYDAKSLAGSDAQMKTCLERGGTWKVNDSAEARADALQRAVNNPEHQALRRRVLREFVNE